MRKIEPLELPDVTPNRIGSAKPSVFMVAPTALRVDERYQRQISQRSAKLIARMVAGWDWCAFKPPIVVRGDEEGIYDVVDGQHTAIAAATHPEITVIPALLIKPEDVAGRAMAFVKHNRDRISVTKVDEWNALVTAGDEHAIDVRDTCLRHGVTILRAKPNKWAVGDTNAIGVVSDIVSWRHPIGAGRVFSVCVRAQLAPLAAEYLRAVDLLMFGPAYKGEIKEEQIITALCPKNLDETVREARKFGAEHRESLFRSLASVIYRDRNRRRA